MRKIAVVGFKGGIGKTTTSINLSAALALRGHKVMLVDTDTQANVVIALGLDRPKKSLADVLARKATVKDCLLPARPNLDLLPSDISLFKTQQRMVLEMAREELFNELFAGADPYDFQIFDCAPSASLLTVNVISYVDEILVPISMEPLALTGAYQFVNYLKSTTRTLGRGGSIRFIVPTFYDPRRRVSERILKAIQKGFDKLVTHPIYIDTKLSEAPGVGKSIFEYAPKSRAAVDYARLTERVATMPPVEETCLAPMLVTA